MRRLNRVMRILATIVVFAVGLGEPLPLAPSRSVSAAGETVQVNAWVDDPNPLQYSTVTVFGELIISGRPKHGIPMYTSWHYKTKDSHCDNGITDSRGIARCKRRIGPATKCYQVGIDVAFTYKGNTFATQTSFTPECTSPSEGLSAWVNKPYAPLGSGVSVFARCLIDGRARRGIPMLATWHYGAKDRYCGGISDARGIAGCSTRVGWLGGDQTVSIDIIFTYKGDIYQTESSFSVLSRGAPIVAMLTSKPPLATSQPTVSETIVYITKTGQKYHRVGCRYLRQSKIEVTCSEAISRGYTSCKVCNPICP